MINIADGFSISYFTFALVCFLVGFGGFVDASAGGGGLISLPAYFLTGMPAIYAYGCNKLSATCGTSLAVAKFWKHKAVHLNAAIFATIGSLTGSYFGAKLALLMSDTALRTIQLVIIPCIAVVIFTKKNFHDTDMSDMFSTPILCTISLALGIMIGSYDAIVGPGTGTIAIIAFALITKFDVKTASGNAKILNLASGVGSFVTFAMAGTFYWQLAIPAGICGIIGNHIGATLALKKGVKYIRPMLICVVSLLLLKILYDLVF